MDRMGIITFLKNETNIEWLKILSRFLNSHISFLEHIKELEENSDIKKEQN